MKHKRAEDLGEGICPFQLTSNFKNPSPHPLARNRSDRLSVRSQPPPLKVLGSVRTFFKTTIFNPNLCFRALTSLWRVVSKRYVSGGRIQWFLYVQKRESVFDLVTLPTKYKNHKKCLREEKYTMYNIVTTKRTIRHFAFSTQVAVWNLLVGIL